MTQLLVGLGNPGPDYAESRHNAGCWVVETLARRLGGRWTRRRLASLARVEWEGVSLVLARPATYMNLSGRAVAWLLRELTLDVSQLIVVHDDLDLPIGKVRVRQKGSHGGHHGIESIMETLGSQTFCRVKVGIGRPETKAGVVDYVLIPLNAEERSALDDAVERAAEMVLGLVRERAKAG